MTTNNGSDDGTPIDPIHKKLLWDEAARGIANAMAHIQSTWYGDEGVLYTNERERLGPRYLPPFCYGASATLFLFLNFRILGHPSFQSWRKQVWQGVSLPKNRSSSIKSSMPPKPKPTPPSSSLSSPPSHQPPMPMGYLERKRKSDIEKTLQSMKLLTDLLVSISVGISGTIFMLEGKRKYMRKDFEEAPLVPGRSVVGEQMCPLFLKAVSLEQETSNEAQEMKENDPNMATILTFVGNCRRRAELEKKIRQDRGLKDDVPVTVPFSGFEEQ